MTIKGLSRRAAVLGHIKIGGRKRINTQHGERIIPERYDHFVVTTNEQGDLGYIPDDILTRKLKEDHYRMLKAEATERIYEDRMIDGELQRKLVKTIQHTSDDILYDRAEKLTRILVTLPFDDPDQNLVTSLSVYDRNGCRCRGDNESADWIDPESGEVTKVSCPCNMLRIRLDENDEVDHRRPHEMAKKGMTPNENKGFMCKANGVLRVKIEQARTIGGVYLFRTTSMNSIRQLLDSMVSILDITGGTLAGYPLNLVVEPKKLRPKPNKPAHIGYVVNLIFKADEDAFLRYVIEKIAVREQLKAQLHSKEIQQLPAPGHEPRQEQVAIAEEYYVGSIDDSIIDTRSEETTSPREGAQDAQQQPAPAEEQPNAPVEAQTTPEPVEASESTPAAKEGASREEEQHTAAPPVEDSAAQSVEQEDHQNAEPDQKDNGFPSVILDKPEHANTAPASKELRKDFFLRARNNDIDNDRIRVWIEELWQVQSSAALKTWQVEAMIESLR